MSHSKKQLRRQIRDARRALSDSDRCEAAARVAQLLLKSRLFQRSRHIALYLPSDGELDSTPLLHAIWCSNKLSYLPMVQPPYSGRLRFASYNAKSRMVNNRYGIPEPSVSACTIVPAWALDLVLLPLVAFDEKGYRLGMGGGYYDRTFNFLSYRQYWRKPCLIGLAYDFQKIEAVPREPWDIPLSGIVTENRLYPSELLANGA